MKERGKESC